MKIRRAYIQDLDELKQIGERTFAEAFSSDNTFENMTVYLNKEFSTEQLSQALADEHSEIYFVAFEGNTIGYLKVNFGPSQTDIKDVNALEIERIYVLKEFHGKNVGKMLYDQAIEIAHRRKSEYIWLGVWEKNPRAIRFYEKNGFVAFDKHIFSLGEDKQTDVLMKLGL